MIHYCIGDAVYPNCTGNIIIPHICNDIGGWGAGFVLAISKRWKLPEQKYYEWYKSNNNFRLGEVQFVKVEDNIIIANMIAQKDIIPKNGIPPIRYNYVKKCLIKVAVKAKGLNASIHMPRIGCGLAGGHWIEIEKIINDTLIKENINVWVYDLK